MAEQAEVIVLGMGPGSEDLAEKLAEAGLDVVGIDGNLVGGECPYWGCVPSKMMIRAANLVAEARRVPGMAGDSTVRPDWAPVAARIREEATDDWDDTVAVKRFEDKGGRFVRGWGKLDGPTRVVVGDRTFEATRAIVLGVGARPWTPPVPGLAETPYWTNREAIEVETLPATPGHPGRGRHRGRAGPGLLPLRRRGDHPRGGRPAAGVGGRGVLPAPGLRVRAGGHRRPHVGHHQCRPS